MNSHSSRSHAVLTLHVVTRERGDSEAVTRTESKLHLIDLAGSERQARRLVNRRACAYNSNRACAYNPTRACAYF